MSKFVKLAFAFAFVLAMSAVVFAQSSTMGAIGGTVSNPSKEVVPGAAVTVETPKPIKEETATTDDQGTFRIVNLQPGTVSSDDQRCRFQSLQSGERCS